MTAQASVLSDGLPHLPEKSCTGRTDISGRVLDEEGRKLGQHEGYPFYTIGQRRGLGIWLNKTLFVKETLPEQNRVIVCDNLRALEKQEMLLTDWNLIDPETALNHPDVIVKIRYRKQANRCTVTCTGDGCLHVNMHEPLASVAPGQAAVFYRDELVLGGGIIATSR